MGIMKSVKNRYSIAKTKSQSLQNTSSVVSENEPFSNAIEKAETEMFASKERYPVRQIPTKRSQNSHPISAPKSTLKITKKSPTLEVGQGRKEGPERGKKTESNNRQGRAMGGIRIIGVMRPIRAMEHKTRGGYSHFSLHPHYFHRFPTQKALLLPLCLPLILNFEFYILNFFIIYVSLPIKRNFTTHGIHIQRD
ncbi:MAG: hypothetical protein IIW89_00755 [Alistipes sp.]|nr:hypothetical protein [Alistipes sp.]